MKALELVWESLDIVPVQRAYGPGEGEGALRGCKQYITMPTMRRFKLTRRSAMMTILRNAIRRLQFKTVRLRVE